MKKILTICILGLLAVGSTSCGLDNYDAPESKLKGEVLYKDASGKDHKIYLRGTAEAVKLSLFQYGYELTNGIDVFLNQEGVFESTLFNGEYHLVPQAGNGPWKTIEEGAKKDTISFNLNGSLTLPVYVTPYYLIENAKVSLTGYDVKASCDITKVITDGAIDQVAVFIGKTQFVDEQTWIVRHDISDKSHGDDKNFLFTITDSNQKEEIELSRNRIGKVYTRIGVKAAGTDQFIYSPVQEIELSK